MHTSCVDTAAVRLMLNHPFWTELFYSMRVIEDENIPTLATDGERMWVNPTFWKGLNIDHKVAALAHESCHKMLHHCTRGMDFVQPFGNIAADIVVNTLLVDSGFKIHPSWVQPEAKYKDWTFEAIYRDIMNNLPPPPQGGGGGQGDPQDGGDEGDDDSGDGDQDDGQGGGAGQQQGQPKQGKGKGQGKDQKPGDGVGAQVPSKWKGVWRDIQFRKGTSAEIEKFEREVEQTVAKAIASAEGIGALPAGIKMQAERVIRIAEEKWYDHLQRYMQSLRAAEYNWARVNKRMAVCHRIVAPDIYSEALGEALVFIDASGSCYTQAVQAGFASHFNAIIAEAKPRKLVAAFFDTMVHNHAEIDPGELELTEQPQGGGGTSFADLFKWAEEMGYRPDVVIVLTDMYGTFPTEEPPFPVVWASTSGREVLPPFGELIEIK